MSKIRKNEFSSPAKSKRGELPMDPAQKFARVECQIRQAVLGSLEFIVCPYCASNVKLGVQKLCCKPMGEAAASVLRCMETECLGETDGCADYSSEQQLIEEPVETVTRFDVSNSIQ
jgi:hypothetical protein